MPLTDASVVKKFIDGIDRELSEKLVRFFFNSSPNLKKIKSYADARGIEFLVFAQSPNFWLNDREQAQTGTGKVFATCFSLLMGSGGEIKKIILLPAIFIVARKKQPGFLKQAILACLHEIAHTEENIARLEDSDDQIIHCPFVKTSCLFEEIKTAGKTRSLAKSLKIRVPKKEFLKHFLAGILAPGLHNDCFAALNAESCPLQSEIKKNRLYKILRRTTVQWQM